MKPVPERSLEELRTSPGPILLFLAGTGYLFTLLRSFDLWILFFWLLLPVVWWLHARFSILGRWLTICLSIAEILYLASSLNMPSILILMAIPTVLAVTMLDMKAGLEVGLVTTAIQAGIQIVLRAQISWDFFTISMILTWCILGLLFLTHRSISLHYHWLDEYAESSSKYMHEAQSHMVELNSALFSLANANRQLKAANERMDALRAIAEDAQKTKTMFLSKVSHELRTPLNMIIGLVELMVNNPTLYSMEVPPEMDKDLQVVLRNCQHLSSMINDVLDLTRVETGQVSLHKEWIQLEELFNETSVAVQPLIEKKSLELILDIQPNLPAVYCDRTRIRQVIFNLVSNAARFTERGGIYIQARADNGNVEVSVSDTGPGIPPEDLEHIFEPFFQGSRNLWRGREGSGLGLSISQQFIKLHDGRLWAESEFGRGSQFHFALPVAQGTEFLRSAGQWIRNDWVWREEAFKAGKLPVEQLPNKPRVLLYDLDGSLFPNLNRFVEQVDILAIQEISNASEEAKDFSANVLVINAAREEDLVQLTMKARTTFPALPVVGCVVTRREHRAIEMGATGYLIKPVSSQALETAIHNAGHPVQRILIVDDDPEIQHMFRRMLSVQNNALVVESASSGSQAFEKLNVVAFDLILLDIIMQDIDGWQVLKKLKQDDQYRDIPVYIVTAQDPEDRPITSDFLLATISQGISPGKLLRGTLDFSKLLLTPESELAGASSS
jgi:signal transduction histidine kinase/CheY-like chemotaxis protein